MSITVVITLLCLIACCFWVNIYFQLVYYSKISDSVWWMPAFLQMRDCRCDEIVETEFGLKFGRSNAYWGLGYYTVLSLIIICNTAWGFPNVDVIFIITLLAFAYSVYLAWGLYILRVACRSCLATHILNLAIFMILLATEWDALFISS